VSDHRDIFNSLIYASVAAQHDSRLGITHSKILNREGLASFLWSAHRELDSDDTLEWCNFKVRKRGENLLIRVVGNRDFGCQDRVFILTTSREGIAQGVSSPEKEKEGSCSDPLMFVELASDCWKPALR